MNSATGLKASFYVLQKNDMLLQNKIRSIKDSTIYTDIINEYFHNLVNIHEDEFYSESRIKLIIESFKKMWVKKHQKRETFLIFEDFSEFEKNLFKLPYYRGHFIHQYNVFLLGYFILSNLLKNEEVKTIFRRNSDHPYFTWMLASTFHDMGYPIEKIEELISLYFDMFLKVKAPFHINIEDILTSNFFDYIDYISQFHYCLNRLQENVWQLDRNNRKDYQFQNLLLNKLRKKDHGVISALLLLHTLLTKEKLLNIENWINRDLPFWIMPACHAIILHTFSEKEIQIEFEKFPFAFLLSLCDELQDWGRSLNENDQSVLKEIRVENINVKPKIRFNISCNMEGKYEKLKALEKKLNCNKIKIKIFDEDSKKLILIPKQKEIN